MVSTCVNQLGGLLVVDRTSGLPAYRQVADDLRARIRTGEFAPGAKLPPEQDLVDRYDVSRPTLRKALEALKAEGLLISAQGKGYFVRTVGTMVRLHRLSRGAREANQAAFLGDIAAAGGTADVRVGIRFEPADDRVAGLLDLAVGAEVCVRDRVMSANGVTVQLSVSRLPRTVTAGTAIEEEDTGVGGLYSRLEEAGHRLDHFTETVGARMPDPAEVSALQLPPGVPVLAVTRVAYTDAGGPIELNDMVLGADRFQLTYDIPAN